MSDEVIEKIGKINQPIAHSIEGAVKSGSFDVSLASDRALYLYYQINPTWDTPISLPEIRALINDRMFNGLWNTGLRTLGDVQEQRLKGLSKIRNFKTHEQMYLDEFISTISLAIEKRHYLQLSAQQEIERK